MGHRSNIISKRYRVKDDAEVKVTNVIGQEQPGSWSMSMDDELIASGTDEVTTTIGKGVDLAFRELRVVFGMHDMNRQHDRLTATTVVTGGKDELEITHDQQGEPGDTATYITLIQFV